MEERSSSNSMSSGGRVRRTKISMIGNEIDPLITEKRREWGDIFDNPSIVDDPQLAYVNNIELFDPKTGKIDTDVDSNSNALVDSFYQSTFGIDIETSTALQYRIIEHLRTSYSCKSEKDPLYKLSHIWYTEARSGNQLLYPRNEEQLKYYVLYGSSGYVTLVTSVILLQLLLPFFEIPFCTILPEDVTTSLMTKSTSSNSVYPSRLSLALIFLALQLVQLFDVFVRLKSMPYRRILKPCSFIGGDHNSQWIIIRLIIIVAQVLETLAFFGDQTNRRILRCLVPLVFISRRENFKQIIEGVLSAIYRSNKIYLGCAIVLFLWGFTGFCLFENFPNGNNDDIPNHDFSLLSAAFYTTFHCFLSRPTVLYRLNAISNRNVFVLVWFMSLTLVADVLIGGLIIATGNRYFRDFSSFNYRRRLKYRRHGLLSIFALLADDIDRSKLSVASWVKFCQANKYFIGREQAARDIFHLEDTGMTGFVNVKQFFRICGAIACRIEVRSNNQQLQRKTFIGSNSSLSSINSHSITDSNIGIDKAGDVMNPMRESKLFMGRESQLTKGGERHTFEIRYKSNNEQSRSQLRRCSDMLTETFLLDDLQLSWLSFVQFLNEYSIDVPSSFSISLFWDSSQTTPMRSFNLFATFSALMHVFLLADLSTLTSQSPTTASLVFNWLIFAFFVFETFIRSYSLAANSRITFFYWIRHLANLIALSCIGRDVTQMNQIALEYLVIIEASRLTRYLLYLKGSDTLRAILPIVARIFVLLGCVVYIFAIIGHTIFCQYLSEAEIKTSGDDDASGWIRYSQILNFNSMLQSFFTLTQVALLSNWSIVMDAAIASSSTAGQRAQIYVFFYAFRIFSVLVCIPLFMSFIIQSFMQQLQKRQDRKIMEQSVKERKINIYKHKATVLTTSIMVDVWSSDGKETVARDEKLLHEVEAKNAGEETLKALRNLKSAQIQLSNHLDVFQGALNPIKEDLDSPSDVQLRRGAWNRVHASYHSLPSSMKGLSSCFEIAELRIFKDQFTWLEMLEKSLPSLLSISTKEKRQSNRYLSSTETITGKMIESAIPEPIRRILPLYLSKATEEEIQSLGHLWFMDAINGMKISISDDISLFLKAYSFNRSPIVSAVFDIGVLFQTGAVIFSKPYCMIPEILPPGEYIFFSDLSITILDCVLGFGYLVEVGSDIYVGKTTRATDQSIVKMYIKNWTYFRLISSILIIIDCFLFFGSVKNGQNILSSRFTRALFPFLLISRQNNLRQLLHGVFVAFKKSILVYNLLLALLLLWALLGYFLFQRLTNISYNYFETFAVSFATVLHCFTSSPFSLIVLQTMFHYSRFIEFFFLAITLTTEVLVINLIIAVGNSVFRTFADHNFNRRLLIRTVDLCGLWSLYTATKNQVAGDQMHIADWVRFCSAMKGHYTVDLETAQLMFRYVQQQELLQASIGQDKSSKTLPTMHENDTRDADGDTDEDHDGDVIDGNDEDKCDLPTPTDTANSIESTSFYRVDQKILSELSDTVGQSSDDYINIRQFFRLIAMVTSRVRFDTECLDIAFLNNSNSNDTSSSQSSSRMKRSGSTISTRFQESINQGHARIDLIDRYRSNTTSRRPSLTVSAASAAIESSSEINLDSDAHADKEIKIIPGPEMKIPAILKIEERRIRLYIDQKKSSFFEYDHLPFPDLCFNVVELCRDIMSLQLVIGEYRVLVSTLLGIVFRILLAIHLVFYANINGAYYRSTLSQGFGWVVAIFFWIEMLVTMIASGELTYFRIFRNCIEFSINVIVFVTKMIIAWNPDAPFALFWLLFAQCVRLISLFWLRNDPNDRLQIVIFAYTRVLMILGGVIFAFAIFGQSFYCGRLSSSSVHPNADDDASTWLLFSEILNFDSFVQSIFTLFEIMVLGSWGMIMDAAVIAIPITPYFYFYAFRVLTTVVVLPLLLSFVVSAFNKAQDRRNSIVKSSKVAPSLDRLSNMTNIENGVNCGNASFLSVGTSASTSVRSFSSVSTKFRPRGVSEIVDNLKTVKFSIERRNDSRVSTPGPGAASANRNSRQLTHSTIGLVSKEKSSEVAADGGNQYHQNAFVERTDFYNHFQQIKADDFTDTFVAVWGSATGIEDAEVRVRWLRKVELENIKSAILYYELLDHLLTREFVIRR